MSSPFRSYAKLITAGQDRDATERERVKGAAVATELRRVIAPFFLRREKRDVLVQRGSEEQQLQDAATSSEPTSTQGEIAHHGGEITLGRDADTCLSSVEYCTSRCIIMKLESVCILSAVWRLHQHAIFMPKAL